MTTGTATAFLGWALLRASTGRLHSRRSRLMAGSAPHFVSGGPTDEQLLNAALVGDQQAAMLVTKQLHPYLAKIVRRRAGDLPGDIQEEIINDLWGALFRRGGSRPSNRTARKYVASFASHAIDRVRAAYRAPDQRSRARDDRLPPSRLHP